MEQRPGFNLIEILLAVSFFVIVVLITSTMYIMAQNVYSRGSNQNELTQNARVSLDRMSREIRQAVELITDFSTSTPVNEILFQDGHNTSKITYIKYYLEGTDLKRSHLAYYFDFPQDPNIYVYIYSLDENEDPPLEKELEDRIIAEYFQNLEFLNNNGLLQISIELGKDKESLEIDTNIFIRNW